MKRKRPKPKLPGFDDVKRRRSRIVDWEIPHTPPQSPAVPDDDYARRTKARSR